MKGPNIRHTLDVRRTWVCPRCGRSRKAPGQEVQQICRCAGNGVITWMRLVEALRIARPALTYAVIPCESADEAEARMGPDPNPRPNPPPRAPDHAEANAAAPAVAEIVATESAVPVTAGDGSQAPPSDVGAEPYRGRGRRHNRRQDEQSRGSAASPAPPASETSQAEGAVAPPPPPSESNAQEPAAPPSPEPGGSPDEFGEGL